MFLAHFLLQPIHLRAKVQSPFLKAEDSAFLFELANIEKKLSALEPTSHNSLASLISAAQEFEVVIRQSSQLGMQSFGLSSGEIALGMRPEVDEACNQLGGGDWMAMRTLTGPLKLIEDAYKAPASPAETASCLAFLIKRAFLAIQSAKVVNAEVTAHHEFLSAQIGPCWDAFDKVFRTLYPFRVDNLDSIPKFLSRFIHFWRCYADSAELTDRNMRHAEDLAPHIYLCMLKHAMSVPAHKIGRYYSGQKMAREILSALALRYPASKPLKEFMFHALEHAREYYVAISKDARKLKVANLIVGLRQLTIDNFIESMGPNVNAKAHDASAHPSDFLQGELLTDLAQCAASNRFGTAGPFSSFKEPGILHLHYAVHNEASLGLYLHMIYEGRPLSVMIRQNHAPVLSLVSLALQNSIDGNRRAMKRWEQLGTQLAISEIAEHLAELEVPLEQVRGVHVYADAHLANAPWKSLFAAKGGSLARAPVAVRVGSLPTDSLLRAETAFVSGAWLYDVNPHKSARRRGELREGAFGNLPGVQLETGRVEGLIANAGLAVDRSDNLSAADILERIDNLSSRAIMHLACHGVAATGGRPVVWLPRKPSEVGDRPQYSALHAERIFRTNWEHCEFVFINACFGGSSAPFVGGPPLGFSEPFAASGVRSMVAPLWPVNDEVAATFAEAFYTSLAMTRDYCVAYNAACDALAADPSADQLTIAAYTFLLF
ncbi:MAG TPA: CHAT domain-containing protein [Rhizomicrobium sp.]|nr:CHAT domain-containing protein [Rhizomicrobium sp.]